jgi:hypothetical protein
MENFQQYMLTKDVLHKYIRELEGLKKYNIEPNIPSYQIIKHEAVKHEPVVKHEAVKHEPVVKHEAVKHEPVVKKKPTKLPKDFDHLFWGIIRVYEPTRWATIYENLQQGHFPQIDLKYEFLQTFQTPIIKSYAREVITKIAWLEVINDLGSSVKICVQSFMNIVKVLEHRRIQMEMPIMGTIIICRGRCIQILTEIKKLENIVLWVEIKNINTKYIPVIGSYNPDIVYHIVDNIYKSLYSISKYKLSDLEELISKFGIIKEDRKYKKNELYDLISNYLDTL